MNRADVPTGRDNRKALFRLEREQPHEEATGKSLELSRGHQKLEEAKESEDGGNTSLHQFSFELSFRSMR